MIVEEEEEEEEEEEAEEEESIYLTNRSIYLSIYTDVPTDT